MRLSHLIEARRRFYYHASRQENRQSIARYGLRPHAGKNWDHLDRRDLDLPRIPKGVFLFSEIGYAYAYGDRVDDEEEWDVWQVDVRGLDLLKDPEPYGGDDEGDEMLAHSYYVRERIAPERLRLVEPQPL
jgi:hypothetical protein